MQLVSINDLFLTQTSIYNNTQRREVHSMDSGITFVFPYSMEFVLLYTAVHCSLTVP